MMNTTTLTLKLEWAASCTVAAALMVILGCADMTAPGVTPARTAPLSSWPAPAPTGPAPGGVAYPVPAPAPPPMPQPPSLPAAPADTGGVKCSTPNCGQASAAPVPSRAPPTYPILPTQLGKDAPKTQPAAAAPGARPTAVKAAAATPQAARAAAPKAVNKDAGGAGKMK